MLTKINIKNYSVRLFIILIIINNAYGLLFDSSYQTKIMFSNIAICLLTYILILQAKPKYLLIGHNGINKKYSHNYELIKKISKSIFYTLLISLSLIVSPTLFNINIFINLNNELGYSNILGYPVFLIWEMTLIPTLLLFLFAKN